MYLDTSLRPQGEQQQVEKMKLSEAIRIGARMRPQCEKYMFVDGRSCALGAAYEVYFGYPGDRISMTTKISGKFAIQYLRDIHSRLGELTMDIWTKNDRGESRESIADWLEAQGF